MYTYVHVCTRTHDVARKKRRRIYLVARGVTLNITAGRGFKRRDATRRGRNLRAQQKLRMRNWIKIERGCRPSAILAGSLFLKHRQKHQEILLRLDELKNDTRARNFITPGRWKRKSTSQRNRNILSPSVIIAAFYYIFIYDYWNNYSPPVQLLPHFVNVFIKISLYLFIPSVHVQ